MKLLRDLAERVVEARANRDVVPASVGELRSRPRFAVDESALLQIVNQSAPLPCRVVDLSLGGCRLRTRETFRTLIRGRAEVSFRVNGIAFRFGATVQWTDGRNQLGLRFLEMSHRRREELAEVLGEVAEEEAARAAPSVEEVPAPGAEAGQPDKVQPEAEVEKRAGIHVVEARARSLPEAPIAASAKASDRRVHGRHAVDTSAKIFLINVRAALPGRIVNLSMGGCRIRTDERFPVGIYTRVETEFRLEGLPFRLAGVTQSIYDRHTVGVRFLDMSERKREQLEQLIGEIEGKLETGSA